MSNQPKKPDLFGSDSDDEAGEVPSGTYIPPDQPMGAQSFGTTRSEERRGETFEERTRHLEPEQEHFDSTAVGRLAQEGDGDAGELDEDGELFGRAISGEEELSAEEQAVHYTQRP